jgi:hypothetical protein
MTILVSVHAQHDCAMLIQRRWRDGLRGFVPHDTATRDSDIAVVGVLPKAVFL